MQSVANLSLLDRGDLLIAFSRSQEHFSLLGADITNGIDFLRSRGAVLKSKAAIDRLFGYDQSGKAGGRPLLHACNRIARVFLPLSHARSR